ncbi:MAG: metal ABC transporter permease [Dehalococcoidia bacterium]
MLSGPLQYSFMQNAYLVGAIVSLIAGVVGFFVVIRGLSFAGHALSHIGFAGAAGAVLIGVDPLAGLLVFCLVAALAMGLLGDRVRGRDVAIGVVMAFSLGLGTLFLKLYTRYASEVFSILFGTILGVSSSAVLLTLILGLVSVAAIIAIYRPLLFASIDPEVAQARGVPVRALSIVFFLIVGLAVAQAVQVVGVLLIFTLLVAPPATAQYLTRKPGAAVLLAALLALVETWIGITLAYYWSLPVSFFISTLSCGAYVGARLLAPYLPQTRAEHPPLAAGERVVEHHFG